MAQCVTTAAQGQRESDLLHSPLQTHVIHCMCLSYDSHCGEVVTADAQGHRESDLLHSPQGQRESDQLHSDLLHSPQGQRESDLLHFPLKTHAMHCLCLWYDSHCGEVVMVNDCQVLCLVLHNKNVQMETNICVAV